MLQLAIILFLIISNCTCILAHEPNEVAYVCPGGLLNLTCDANGIFLIWNVSIPGFRSESLTLLRDSAQTMEVLQVNMIRFNISNRNRNTTSPLSSVMLLDNVPIDLNRTTITCSEVPNGVTTLISKTMIHIIGNEVSQTTSCSLTKLAALQILTAEANISTRFERAHVRVTVELIMTDDDTIGISYDVHATPNVNLTAIGKTIVQVMIPYNKQHNLSIVASLCGHNATSIYRLIYAKCDYPLLADNAVEIEASGYRDPALQGTNVTFTCPSDMVLTGPSTSTCMANGEWEPDPRDTDCKVNCDTPEVNGDISLNYNSTLEGSLLTIECEESSRLTVTVTCLSDGNWSPDPHQVCSVESTSNLQIAIIVGCSSIVLMLLAAIVIAATVIALIAKRKPVSVPQTPDPIYDEISQMNSDNEQMELSQLDPEMSVNAAYTPICSRNLRTH